MAKPPSSYCLAPDCLTLNSTGDQCQACGASLLLAGRYRAVAALGKTGRTWRGQTNTGEPCLIQRRRAASGPTAAGFLERLRRVGQYPQVPRLLAAFSQSGHHYWVWEYIEGASLRAAGASPASEVQIHQILARLLPLLGNIHRQGIIHRDIKPENIIEHAQQLWLVDFGSAVAATATTAQILPVGNAEYSAPEQLLGQPSFASDLYSVGLVCVQLLTATPPFNLYQRPEQRWQSYLSTPISPALEQLLTKLLRPAPQRYRSAAAALADLPPPPVPHPPVPKAWRCTQTLTGHRGEVTAVVASNDQVISGGSDRQIQFWTWQGQRTQVLQRSWFEAGHRDRINGLQLDPSGDTLLSSSADGTLCQWSLIDYGLQQCQVSPGWETRAFVATADVLISGGEGGILLWDWAGKVVERWPQQPVTGLAISPNQQILLSGHSDGSLLFWDLRSARILKQLSVEAPVTAINPLQCWTVLAVGDAQGQMHLWDILRMRRLHTVTAHQGPVTAISSALQTLASGGDDGQIHLWEMPAPQPSLEEQVQQHPQALERRATLCHDWSIRAIAFSPDGDRLASGSADETLRFWQR